MSGFKYQTKKELDDCGAPSPHFHRHANMFCLFVPGRFKGTGTDGSGENFVAGLVGFVAGTP